MNLGEAIEKYALDNAVKYNGKAKPGAVIGHIVGAFPEVKSDMKALAKQVNAKIKEINKLGVEKQRKLLEEKYPEMLEKHEKIEEHKLPPLPNAGTGKVVMRLAPYPSGPLHIGNTKTYTLNDEYVKMYNGKLLLIIDDTIGSEEKGIAPEAYKLIPEGLDWLGFFYDKKIIYKSDRLENYYKYAKELINMDKAYVCSCNAERLREYREKQKGCECRVKRLKDNQVDFDKMLSGKYREGEAVLRIKTDMKHPNPAFRDRVIMRISEREHPRTGKKYKVWPLLEFSWAVDDYLLGITHIMRGKELMIESEMEQYIWDVFGWPHKELIHTALMKIKGVKLSKSKARQEVLSGEYFGWDDPRTWSLQALKRRGFLPQAIRNFVLSFGLNQNEITVPVDTFYSENRKLIDATTPRFFFVDDPVKIVVKNAPEQKLKIQKHPENEKLGFRQIKSGEEFFIAKKDYEKLEDKQLYRLKDCLNFIKKGSSFVFHSVNIDDYKKEGKLIMQWVPADDYVEVEVLMPEANIITGYGETGMRNLKVNDVIQAERFGFMRLDKKEKDKGGKEKLFFWFTHQ